jgi:hypothetical protein
MSGKDPSLLHRSASSWCNEKESVKDREKVLEVDNALGARRVVTDGR